MRKIMMVAALSLALAITATATAQAQTSDVESRVSNLEGGLPQVRATVDGLQAQIVALTTLVNELTATVAANTQALEAIQVLGDLGTVISGLDWRVAQAEGAVNTVSGAVAANVASLDNLFLRVEDVEIAVEELTAGGGGSPGLVIANGLVGPESDIQSFPFNTPIFATDCIILDGKYLFNCYMLRDSDDPWRLKGLGMFGPTASAQPLRIDIRFAIP